MASKGAVSKSTEKGIGSVGRFVYDVLLYTLPKCGYPETRLPTTDVKENIYKRPHFVKIAGVSALRVALIMRDKWKQMFESRRKAAGFDDKSLPTFMMTIMRCCPLSRRSTMQTMVEIILALSNEIILFFYSENIEFNATTIIGSVGFTIMNLIGSDENWLETLEDLFEKFDNIGEYTRWITNFIEKFAIPYGSRSDVSELFFQEVKEQHFEDIKRIKDEPEVPSLKNLKDRLGFLPHDLFSAIVAEETESLPENWMLGSGSTLPGDRESPDPTSLCPFFQKGAIGKGKTRSEQSTRSDKISEESELESSVPGRALSFEPPKPRAGSESGGVEETRQRRRRPTGSRNTPEKSVPLSKIVSTAGSVLSGEPPKLEEISETSSVEEKKSRQRRMTGSKRTSAESVPSPRSLEPALGPVSPPKSQASSESRGIAEKKSGKGQAARSRETSQQTTQSQPSSMDSPEVGLEDELGRMNLGPAEASRKSKGATPKKGFKK